MHKTKRFRIKDKSTDSKVTYLLDHLLFGILSGYNVYKVLPMLVPVAYNERSVLRLVLCMLLTSAVGIALTFGVWRNAAGTLQDILSGAGLYVVLTIGAYVPIVVMVLLSVAIVVTFIGMQRIVAPEIERRDYLKQIILIRILKILWMVRRNAGIVAAILLIVLPVSVHFINDDSIADVYYENREKNAHYRAADYRKHSSYEECGLKKNIDTIGLIYDNDVWMELPQEEKKEVIKAVCYCECKYLGVGAGVRLKFTDDLEGAVKGGYNDDFRTIYYSNSALEFNNKDAFSIIVEEVYHCYEHDMIALYLKLTPAERDLFCFEECDSWIKNMDEYIGEVNSEEEFMEYYYQPIEMEAKLHAFTAWEGYLFEIGKLMDGQEDGEFLR